MKSYEVTLWIMNNAIDDFGPEVATAYVAQATGNVPWTDT